MKQFLRHISLLLALFVATANLSAQTYNGGTWYSLYDTEQKNNTTVGTTFCEKAVFAPAESMTFGYKKYSGISIKGKLQVQNNVNGNSWSGSKGEVSYSSTSWNTSQTISLDANISHIRYKMPSGTGASVRNHFVKLKKHILLNDNTSNGQTWGVSSITLTDNSLATAEGKTSSNYYTIKFRSFLASGNITITSDNSEFHFGSGATSISLNTANNYFARIGGTASKSSTNPADHRNVNEYETKVYFSPAVQYNKNTRSTTIKITDGTSTAYIYLSAPVIPTYFFKAEAISSPAEGGTATATFANGQSTYSIIAPDYATGSLSTTVTFTAAPKTADGYVFEGWKKDHANATFHKQGADQTTITETITSSALNPNGLASQLTLYAIYSRRYTAKITGSNYTNKLVNDSLKADYQFINTQTAIPTNSEADPFYFKIEHNFTGNDTREGSTRPNEVIAYDPTTNTITALNEGTATITFYQKNTSSHEAVTESFTVQVIKHTPQFTWNAANTTYYYGTSIPNIFSTTNPDCQYTIVSDNENVAKVIDNTLHIYNVEETTNITVTQAENYKWNGKTETYTITPANPNNHVTFTINSENYYNVFRYGNTGDLSWKHDGVLLGSPDVGSGASNYNDRYYDIVFTGIPDKLSFKYERSTSIATGCDWYVKESVDGVTWSKNNVWEKGNSNADSVEVQLNPTTRYLRFCYSGNYGGYFRNVKVTELEKFEADPNPLDFGTRPVGEGEQLLPLNFSHANAGRITTATIIGKDAQYFTVTPTVIPGTGRDLLGTTHLNVAFDNKGEDRGLTTPYEATLVITDNAGNREEVTLTGIRHGKATPEFTWNPNNFPYYFNTSIANIVVSSNTDYANCPLTITSSNENIAKVENGRLYIYDQSGEVTFTVTQRGNNRYNGHTESFTFTPKAKPDLEVPFQVTPEIYNQAITVGNNCSWDGDDHHLKLGDGAWDDTKKTAILVFSGRPDKLTFSYATSNNVAVVEIGSFDNPKWEVEESSDGENWKSLWSVRTNSTSWANAEIQLSETTQYVRFSYDGNYAGYFKNINISELVGYKYLRAADGHYLSRGAKYGTQAVVDAFGVVSRLSRYTHDNENIYTRFFFVDNEQYMFETETEDEQRLHEVFTDHGTALNTNHLWQINDNGGIFTIQSANEVGEVSHKGNYITAVNGILAFTTDESEATRWQMEDYTEHPQYIADMLNRQAAAAALKDFGEDINTLEKVRNRLKVEDFETREITIQPLELGEQTGESRTIEGMPHIYEQTITVDPGFYRLTVKALYRISNSEIAWKCNQEKGKESVLAYAYANDVQYPIQSVYASYHSSAIENTDELRDGKYYSTTLSSANVAFDDANRYLNDVYVYVEADSGQTTGTLRYGIKCPSYVPGAWLAYSTITLTHFGRKEFIFYGTVENAATDWKTSGNWNRNAVPNQYHIVTIKADVNIVEPVEVFCMNVDENKHVHITEKGGLTVGPGGVYEAQENSITIDNNLQNAGFLRINPNAPSKPQKVTVNYKTKTFDNGSPRNEVWQYIGMPGDNSTISDLTGITLYSWKETEGWKRKTADQLQAIPAWEGLAFTQSKEQDAAFQITTTPIFEPEKEIKLTCTSTGTGMYGDNLFANSFLAPIDVTQIDGNDVIDPDNHLTRTFFIFNSGSWNDWNSGKGDITAGDYNQSSAGHYYSIPFHSAKMINDGETQVVIPPMQGVYVYSAGEATIKLNYQKHIMAASPASVNMNAPLRAPQAQFGNSFMRIRIQATSQNSGADRLYVIQEQNTTPEYDNGYDGDNILANGQVNIYTNEPFGQMEVSCSNNIDSMWIGFTAGEDSIYTLHFGALVGEGMYIRDISNDSLMILTDGGQYTFYAQPNSVNDMRFQLLLNPELTSDEPEQEEDGVTTNIEDATTIQLWVSDKRLYINHAQPNSQLAIYNASGMLMATPYTLYSTPYTLDLSYLPTGVYILRLNNQAYKFVCE